MSMSQLMIRLKNMRNAASIDRLFDIEWHWIEGINILSKNIKKVCYYECKQGDNQGTIAILMANFGHLDITMHMTN